MQKCCIKGCDSHKYIGEKNIGYFPFPVHDEILLKKWLTQIDLPNWKPGARHHICSMHFAIEDVDSHPNRKQPFLNPVSIPTIFPGRPIKTSSADRKQSSVILTKSQSALPLQVVNIGSNGNCDMSVLRSMPVILIPMQIAGQNSAPFPLQNVMQISTHYTNPITEQIQSGNQKCMAITMSSDESPKLSETFVRQQLIIQPRLRKILPKPDDFPGPESLPAIPKILQPLAVPKTEIPAVPKTMNSDPNGTAVTVTPRYPGNKRPVLRISINKRRNVDASKKKRSTFNEKASNSSSDDTETDDSVNETNSFGKEITIENSSTNRTVTFRLDPKTGEIVATTQEMNKTSRDEEDVETERKVDDTCGRPSAAKLRQLYTKGQRECNALRKRLKILRRRHREEQEEIQRLQEHLIQIGDRVQRTCYEDSAKARGTKRKEAEKCVRSSKDDNCGKLITEKIKEDIGETKESLPTSTNGQSEIPSRENLSKLSGNNGNSALVEDNKDNSSEIRQSSDEKIGGEINGKCKASVRTMGENSIDLKSYSGIDDTTCKEESLETEFLFE